MKAIGPFAQATRGADPILLRTLAWRATTIATVIVLVVGLLGAVLMRQWRVSVAAITIAGGLIFLLQAIQMIMTPPSSAAPPANASRRRPLSAMAHFPLAIPALVTAPGIMAIVAFMAIAWADWTQQGIVIALLLFIMALNLLALLNVRLIFQYVSPTILLVLGWVMAVLQAALAVQYLFNGLVRVGVIHP